MKLRKRIEYWNNIRKGIEIPLINVSININKYKIQKEGSCISALHPSIPPELTEEQIEEVKYHINKAIDIIRDNIKDIDKLR